MIISAHVPSDSVTEGVIPAAQALGLSVILLTDCVHAHHVHFSKSKSALTPQEVIACDVFNPIAVIDIISQRQHKPAAIFSNSDHLQSSTALAADYFGLAGKDWRTTYRAKNKAAMRQHLAALKIDTVWHTVLCDIDQLASHKAHIPFPAILKPRAGVASQHVSLVYDYDHLYQQCETFWLAHPGQVLLLEEYLEGPLYTLETLGDGKCLQVLGGFHVTLSPPPHFIELEATWQPNTLQQQQDRVLDIITRFSIGFGSCHTEYVMTAQGPRIIEINYRTIGDYREFLLCEALHIPLFEIIIRLHLGESLPTLELAKDTAHIRYFTASSSGKIQLAPNAFVSKEKQTHITYRPLRHSGEVIKLSYSNKDYLGVLQGTSACAQTLTDEINKASKTLSWEITI
ncbi:MAG: siderophore biosynthesis protein [Ottowia sp.]|nr:siderophore biosynthesis protein [Ottowia sp.]